MVAFTIAQGTEPLPLAHDDRNAVKVTLGVYVMITLDTNGKPAGIRAVGQGRTVDVMLDRVQLKSFAEQILRALVER